jgi:hypothetical protein
MIWNQASSPQRPRVVALRGPVLGGGRRRRSGLVSMSTLGLLALLGICVWLWQVIGADLGNGSHLGAKHDDGKPVAKVELPAAHVTPAGPGAATLPGRKLEDAPHGGLDPVAQALLSGARDQLARKVAPVTVAVDDPHAAKASPFDLVDRGLSDLFPLRVAVLRHRQREPHLYGLTGRPIGTVEDRRRALTGENLATFLQTFATHLGDEVSLEAGDVVLVQRKRNSAKVMPAIVSDAVDETGAPLVITLDPADKVAREQGLGNYAVKQRFRLRTVDLERMRAALDLGELHAGSPARAL